MTEYKKGYKQALSEVKSEVNSIIAGLRSHCIPDPLGTIQECLAYSEIEALKLVLKTIDEKDKQCF